MIWFIGTLFVVYQLMLQNGFGAISENVTKDLSLTAVGTGVLSGSFLITYSLMQLPAGLALDRFNPRWLMAAGALICAIAAWFFGQADSLGSAIAIRSAMGVGAAVAFPGAGLLARRWINPAQFALAMGLIDCAFGIGAVLGDSGFNHLLTVMDWRGVLVLLSITGLVVSVLIAAGVRSAPPGWSSEEEKPVPLREALAVMLRNRQVLLGMIFYAGTCGTLFGFGGLWDIKLQQAFGYDPVKAVDLNSWIFVGLAISAPIVGLISDSWGRRKPLLVIGSLGSTIACAVVLFGPVFSDLATILVLLIQGIFLGVNVLVFATVCESLPKGYGASAIGLVNAAGCLCGGLLQMIPPMMMGSDRWQPLEVYQQTLTIFLVVLVLATVAALLMHDTRPGWDHKPGT